MRLLYGVLGTAMLGLSACAELGIQSPDLRGSTAESTGPVLAEQALSNAGRFPEDVSDEVATPKPVPPLPARKPAVPQAAIQALHAPQADPDALVRLAFETTTALLGDPALLLAEPPAKLRDYNGPITVLTVFF